MFGESSKQKTFQTENFRPACGTAPANVRVQYFQRRLTDWFLLCLTLAGFILPVQSQDGPPLPTPLSAEQIAAMRKAALAPRRSKLQSPKAAAAAAIGNQAMAIIAPPPQVITNYVAFPFPPARIRVLTYAHATPELPAGSPDQEPIATNSWTWTNLTAFVEVRTNHGPWNLKRSAPWPAAGGDLIATNLNPERTLIEFLSGRTWNPWTPPVNP